MAISISQLLSATFQSESTAGQTLIAFAVIAVVLAVTVSIRSNESSYEGFPLVGKDEIIKSDWDAKKLWLKSAESIIYKTIAKVMATLPDLSMCADC
jgi:hypothetical protein